MAKKTRGRILPGACFLAGGFVLYYFLLVVFGAPLLDNANRTCFLALLMTLVTVAPCLYAFANLDWAVRVLLFAEEPATKKEHVALCTVVGTLCGTWLGAIPIPLDWDRWWQEWPITCVFGCVVGCLVGVLFGVYSRKKIKL